MTPQAPRGVTEKNFFLKKSCERIFRAKSESFVKIEAHIKWINKKNLRGGVFAHPPGDARVKVVASLLAWTRKIEEKTKWPPLGVLKIVFIYIFLKKVQLTPQSCTLPNTSSFLQKIAKIVGGQKRPPPGFDVSIYMLGMLGLISYPPSNFNCIDIAVYNTSMIILGIMSTLVTKQYYFNYKFILIIQ